MRYLLDAKQMKELDNYSINVVGIPSVVLMERAALAVSECILEFAEHKKVLVVAGIGNNGADGLAVARMLCLKGVDVTVKIVGNIEKATGEWKLQRKILQNLGISISFIEKTVQKPLTQEYINIDTYNVIVDAIFGIGLARDITGVYYNIIEQINDSSVPKIVSIDIPSGVDAATGKILNISVKADYTVTFGYDKLGMVLYPGKLQCGEIIVADIGFAKPDTKYEMFTCDRADLEIIPKRPPYSNKGTFGRVLLIAGSKNMAGAAYLSAASLYKMGVGLVKVFTPEENRIILQTLIPEAILEDYNKTNYIEKLTKNLSWADCIIIGPGLGMEEYVAQLLEATLRKSNVPMVIDADGLNLISKNPNLKKIIPKNAILTPHLGELSRLIDVGIDEIKDNIISVPKKASEMLNAVCVCKDARTIVTAPDKNTYINTTGNSGMATAGSGDVLSGIIGGLLAMKLPPYDAAVLGVYIHGLAGDIAKSKTGEYALMARDLLGAIEKVF